VRYRPVDEPIAHHTLWFALLIGLLFTTFLFFYFPLVKGRHMRENAKG
jgi:hypothetical protein